MTDKSVLLIEDDEELAALLTDYLAKERLPARVAANGKEGLALALTGEFCVVLLDIMLPDLGGLDVLRELRTESRVPVIMLTAKGEDIDRILGLELGADDYLPKPFNPRELAARIRAVLRRAEPPSPEPSSGPALGRGTPQTSKVTVGELTLDLDGHRVLLGARELFLTTIEFALLRELALGSGRVLSRDTLLDRIRGRDFEAFDRSIDVHISNLRRKLGDDPVAPRYIRTVRSVGYTFLLPTGEASPMESQAGAGYRNDGAEGPVRAEAGNDGGER